MLGQQIRTWEVLDRRVLDVLRDTPREHFVPDRFRDLAFADSEIPLGHDQYMMTPKMEGRLLQTLEIEPIDDVLEIGAGSGYLTACLARLSERVVSVDIYPEFIETAADKLARSQIDNVELETKDAMELSYSGCFDVIAVTASVPDLDERFIRMLRPRGRLFIVVGRAPVMEARLITMHAGGDWTQECLFETVLTPMLNAESAEPFVL